MQAQKKIIKLWDVINSKICLLLIGFVLTTIVGKCVTEQYDLLKQERTKKQLIQMKRYEHDVKMINVIVDALYKGVPIFMKIEQSLENPKQAQFKYAEFESFQLLLEEKFLYYSLRLHKLCADSLSKKLVLNLQYRAVSDDNIHELLWDLDQNCHELDSGLDDELSDFNFEQCYECLDAVKKWYVVNIPLLFDEVYSDKYFTPKPKKSPLNSTTKIAR